MTANDLTKQILLALPKQFPCRVWRRNVGGGYPVTVIAHIRSLLQSSNLKEALALLGRTRVVHYGLPGESDIDGVIRINGYGVRLAIEVKVARDKLRGDQWSYGRMIETFGGIFLVARSVEEAVEGLRAAVGKRVTTPCQT
jgi:hypothetical protein